MEGNINTQSEAISSTLDIYMGLAKSHLGIISFLLILTRCQSCQEHFNKHVALFVFGDSLFDPGNNNYINTTTELQANFWPYGESYFNPPTGRFSDGHIIPDFIAHFAGLPLIPAYLDPHNNEFLYGANFASAGSGVLDETQPTIAVKLTTQLQYFTDLVKHYRKNLGDVKAEQLLSDAVFLFSCGSNDYQILLENNKSSLLYDEYVEMVIGNLTQVFKVIHEKGGRKIGITTLTSLGCLLPVRAERPDNTCDEELNIISTLHDKSLSKKLQDLTQQWEGFMYSKFELQTEITKRMKNPSKYGLKVGNSACCGTGPFRAINSCGGKRETREFELCDNPNDYLLFDPYHPTEAANLQLSELFWEGDSKVASPYNLKSLFQGCQSSQGIFNKHVALFIFGDSLFDPGNNNYINTDPGFQANFWPYGESYFNPPSGRFSNAEYAGLPLIPAYLDPHYNEFLYGANFASGGAGALVETNTKFSVLDLKTQLQYFSDLEKRYRKDLGDVKAEQLLSDAVYLFSCGCNDYLALTSNNLSNLHYEEYVGVVIGNLTDVFKGIYEKGGRKIGIGTIPPLGCLPYVRAQQPGNTCNEELNTISSLHNRAFSKELQELTQQFEGFMFANYDHSTALSERMKNPSKYGFKVGDSSCCGSGPLRGIYNCGGKRGIREFQLCDNPDDYVFFDAPHPSEAASRQFAEHFWNGDSKVTSPYNLKALFHGTCLLIS
ncbi:unnamed protein product [Lactuca virosa]|uniref:GDSL esterase/lipase 1-like n=1 Tax=Lactuca virosa TaxID=75947 RepID=A0AAU9LUC4_9ASTR|nr:unnamed protein product [Lactuca virosa]